MEVCMDSQNKLQKYKKYKKVHKYKSTHNSVIFRATDSRFCMEVHMDSPKYKSTKSAKKYVKVQKYCMEVHIWTVQPSDKVQKYKKHKSTK